MPINHDRLLAGVQQSLERSGLHVVTESHGLTHDGNRYFGLLQVCDNLSFSGEVKLARKHTTHIERDLPQLVDRAVGMLGNLRQTQEQRFLTYRQHELTDSEAHDFVIKALDARVVPVTRIPEILTEWREPKYPEFRAGRTAWRLFNAFTEVLKGQLDRLPQRTQALHGLMDSACGLVSYRIEDAEIQIAAAV
jgi:hypothetical protein